MGEVYRARDTKLDRDVAIKVLPEDFATDPDRLARFEREAKLLASLNHANIAAIYGLEDEGEQRFIVMEVVEGETLAERIARSGSLSSRSASSETCCHSLESRSGSWTYLMSSTAMEGAPLPNQHSIALFCRHT